MVRGCVTLLIAFQWVGVLTLLAQSPSGPTSSSEIDPDANQPVATIRTTARLVVLDVVVSDGHGKSVKGLNTSDFTLTEDGVAQRLTGFTEHDGALEAPSPDAWTTQEKLPPNTFSVHPAERGNGAMTAIVLGSMSNRDRVFVREQLKEYAKTATMETPVAIFSVDSLGMHLVQDFTSDPEMLQEAVESKRILPPLGFAPQGQVVSHGTLQLSQYLNDIPGRINVIWFSSGGGGAPGIGQGPSDSAFADLATFVQDLKGVRSVLRLSRVAVYAVNASGTCVAQVSDGIETGCLSDITIPSMDETSHGVPSMTVPDVPGGRVAEMAEATGGRAITYTNGFQQAIAEIVATGAHYYTVSYTPVNTNWDGSFRKIKLEVRTGNGAAQRFADWMNGAVKVQHRSGYFARGDPPPHSFPAALSAAEPASASQRKLISTSPKGSPGLGRGGQDDPLKRAMAFASGTPADLEFKVAVTSSEEIDRVKGSAVLPKDNYLTALWKNTPFRNYQVHYSIDPGSLHLHAATDGYHDMFRFVIVVYRDNGEPVNSIATTVPVELNAAQYAQVMHDGLSFEQTVAVPQKVNTDAIPATANFFLRTGVEEVETGRIGAVEFAVELVKQR